MMAKPMKTLELHYPMIQLLIIADITFWPLMSTTKWSLCILFVPVGQFGHLQLFFPDAFRISFLCLLPCITPTGSSCRGHDALRHGTRKVGLFPELPLSAELYAES